MKNWFPKDTRRRWFLFTGVAMLAGTALALNEPGNEPGQTGTGSPAANPKLTLKVDEAPLARDATNSCAPVVEKVSPSVVRIAVTAEGPSSQMTESELDFFRRFFGGRGPFSRGLPGSEREHALGSGVIVSADGYVVTNNHVVQNARDIEVSLNDGRTLAAKVIGTDPQTDVALIKINAQNLPFLTLADSDKVEVGDMVLAVGNPFGIGQTVTRGIVSAKNRATSGEGDEDFIQTDAAINPGNSGGALVDTEGRLVGINSAILSRSGGNQGIGFAVPSNLVRWVADSIIKSGRVQRGLLGVSIQDLTPELAQALKINRTGGALVADTSPGSPAEAAGIKNGDVILKFGDKSIETANQLKLRVAETPAGTTVPVQIDRNGEVKDLNVTIKERTGDKLARNDRDQAPGEKQNDTLNGVAVTNLDNQTRAELRIPAGVQGALITDVDQNSPAYDAGLRPGDVITEINHQPVRNADDAVNLTQRPAGGQTLVKVWSRGGSRYVAVNEGGES